MIFVETEEKIWQFLFLGAIQIKNWKPLTFDNVTENPNATVESILGDLTSVATVRIRLCRFVNFFVLVFV